MFKQFKGTKCPHCGAEMKGEEGSKVCKNMHYQVDPNDPNSYDRPMAKQEKLRRMTK